MDIFEKYGYRRRPSQVMHVAKTLGLLAFVVFVLALTVRLAMYSAEWLVAR